MNSVSIGPAATGKLIRAALKAAFPGVVFSVTTKSYSMGASARVSWTDGPTRDEVQHITCQYEGSTFDSMIDLKSYVDHTVNGQQVHYCTDSVHLDRHYSVGAVQTAVNDICSRWGICPVPVVTPSKYDGHADMNTFYRVFPPNNEGQWYWGLDVLIERYMEGKG